jgi:uracil DNA glycosylase
MEVRIAADWKELLAEEFEKPYFKALTDFVREEYAAGTVFPKGKKASLARRKQATPKGIRTIVRQHTIPTRK